MRQRSGMTVHDDSERGSPVLSGPRRRGEQIPRSAVRQTDAINVLWKKSARASTASTV